MRNSWTIFESAPLFFRLFIQDRVFPLVLTSSSSSKTKQVIAAATCLFTILFLSVCRVVRRVVGGVVETVQTCFMLFRVTCYLTRLNGSLRTLVLNERL